MMDKYHVDICVSKADSSNPDLITIFAGDGGTHNDVLECMNYIKIIQQHYVISLTLYFIQILFLYDLWTLQLNNIIIILFIYVFFIFFFKLNEILEYKARANLTTDL